MHADYYKFISGYYLSKSMEERMKGEGREGMREGVIQGEEREIMRERNRAKMSSWDRQIDRERERERMWRMSEDVEYGNIYRNISFMY